MAIREAILESIEDSQGIKRVALVMKVMEKISPFIDNVELMGELDKLVSEGEIEEIEYILPRMNYRVKSIYFPKGTKFYFKAEKK